MNSQKDINVKISEMTLDDIENVLKIQNETGLSSWKFKDYLGEIKNIDSLCRVVKFDKKIVGFAVVRLHSGDNGFDSSEIYNIAVSRSFQSLGVGQKLFDKVLGELLEINVKEMWLEVRQSNKKAIRFYEKNGFAKRSVRKKYYNNPTENALILQKKIGKASDFK